MDDVSTVILILLSLSCITYYVHTNTNAFDMMSKQNGTVQKPILWIYLNSSDVNSRSWSDFMDRSSRAINLPFLNLCYKSIATKNSQIYDVQVIGGLQDLAVRMGGWDALPVPLQNPNAFVREPELNWIRAAVLAKWGGLWVSPATICLKPFGPLPKKRVVFFGTDPSPAYSSADIIPGLNVVWSPVAEHPLWLSWEKKVRDRLNRRSGGSEFRNDEKSDLRDAITDYKSDCMVISTAEVSRKGPSLKRIELEDLLAAGTEGDIPFNVDKAAVYLPIPYPEILERKAFEWFLRMSEDQILESDLVITYFFMV